MNGDIQTHDNKCYNREELPRGEATARRFTLPFIGWTVLTIHAVALGLASLRYLLPHVPFPVELPNFRVRHGWLAAHAAFSAIALLTGPWQFLAAVRKRWLEAHRWNGRVYCAAVLAGWLTSLPIGAHAQTGAIASAGFLGLGVFWIGATSVAFFSIYRRQLQTHQEWMIRSYALTAAAITLRTYLPLLTVGGLSFEVSYRIVAWACWIPNVCFAEWLVWRRRVRTRALATA